MFRGSRGRCEIESRIQSRLRGRICPVQAASHVRVETGELREKLQDVFCTCEAGV